MLQGAVDDAGPFQHFLIRHRTVEGHGVPVPLVEVVAPRVMVAYRPGRSAVRPGSHLRLTLPGAGPSDTSANLPSAILKDRRLITERVVLC